MKCHICKSPIKKAVRFVKEIQIYECKECSLGFIKQEIIKKNNLKKLNELYDFKEYHKQKKKLRGWFEKLIDEILKYELSGKVLDVGAGFGLFSSILQKKGNFKIDILEPEQKLEYDLKVNKIYKTTFENFRSKFKYDVIVMMDVVEHFENPIINLKKVKLLLNKDGILVIQTPNYKSLMERICVAWAWWMIEDHKFFFSHKSMRKILNKVGFNTKYFMTYEDWYDFKKNLDGNFMYIKNNWLRKIIKGLFFAVFFPLYFLTRHIIWKLGYGGLIFVIAKKA